MKFNGEEERMMAFFNFSSNWRCVFSQPCPLFWGSHLRFCSQTHCTGFGFCRIALSPSTKCGVFR